MPEEKQDPANTQMFRAFVERGEQEATGTGSRTSLLIGAAVVIVIVVALVLIFAL